MGMHACTCRYIVKRPQNLVRIGLVDKAEVQVHGFKLTCIQAVSSYTRCRQTF